MKKFFKGLFPFKTRELVTIGLFAGAAKAASLCIALMGGGMNPVTLILKSAVWTVLWMILLMKVDRVGTLTLSNTVSALFGLFLMGQNMIFLPGLIAVCVLTEFVMYAISRFVPRIAVVTVGIAVSELLSKALSLGISYLGMREQPFMVVPVIIIISLSYLGVIAGLAGGIKMVKELRHAGLIYN